MAEWTGIRICIPVLLGWTASAALAKFGTCLPLGVDAHLTLEVGALLLGVMLGCVFAVARFADELADRVPEPYGTLVVTLSSIIEVCLMLRMMLAIKLRHCAPGYKANSRITEHHVVLSIAARDKAFANCCSNAGVIFCLPLWTRSEISVKGNLERLKAYTSPEASADGSVANSRTRASGA